MNSDRMCLCSSTIQTSRGLFPAVYLNVGFDVYTLLIFTSCEHDVQFQFVVKLG